MLFNVDWRVVETDDAGTREVARGAIKLRHGPSAAAVRAEAAALLRGHFPDTAVATREYDVRVAEA